MLTSLLLLLACSPEALVAEPASLELHAEPTLPIEATVQLRNGTGDEIGVTGVDFDPADLPIRWTGGGPWTLPPDETATVALRFDPQVSGEWQGDLILATTVGSVLVPLTLIAAPTVDEDEDGWSPAMGDCDEADPTAFPGAAEACDGADDDCDGEVDEDFDGDGDGWLDAEACGDDCNDVDPTAFPGAPEDCDSSDSDCNGVIDDIPDLADRQEGVCAGARKVCQGSPSEPDYASLPDYEPSERSCDGLDNDCDGAVDDFDRRGDGTPDCTDDDGDGEAEVDGDCDDTDPIVTSSSCGAQRLVVTSLSDGFATVDLELDALTSHALGGMLFAAAASAEDRVWFSDRAGQLIEGEPSTGTLLRAVPVDSPPWGVAHDAGTLWVAEYGTGDLVGFDTTSGDEVERVALSVGITALTVDEDALWVCGDAGTLWWVRPTTRERTSVAVDVGCYAPPIVDEAGGRVLVLGYGEQEIVAVDRSTLEVLDRVAMPGLVARGVLGDVDLWVVMGVDGGLLRIDPDTLAVLDTWALGAHATDVWLDAVRGDLWVALYGDDRVDRLDPTDGSVRSSHPLPDPLLIEPVGGEAGG